MTRPLAYRERDLQTAARQQWKRPIQPKVTITLPFPPSMNRLWKRGTTGMYRSPRYMSWIRAAGQELELQRPGCIAGNYIIVIQLERKDNRNRDADNFLKACSDLLQQHGVIENDALAESVTAMWVPGIKGCRVTLTAVRKVAA
jgi:Holliday junction resolvase RusA-like endonuclease